MSNFFLLCILWFSACAGKHLGPKDTSLYALKIDGEDLQILDGEKEFFTNVGLDREKVKIEVKTQGDNHPATDAASVAGIFDVEDFSTQNSMQIFDDTGKRRVPGSKILNLKTGENILHIGVVSGDRKESSLYKLSIYRGLLPKLRYPRILYESIRNDGKLEGTLEVTLEKGDFPGVLFSGNIGTSWGEGNQYLVKKVTDVQGIKFSSGVPSGVDMQIKKIGPTNLEVIFLGNAKNHSASNSSFVDLFLKKEAFSGISEGRSSDLLKNILNDPVFFRLDFGDAFLRSSASFFKEIGDNPGVLSPTEISLQTSFVNFSVQPGTYFQLDKHFKIRDLPKGITVQILSKSATQAVLSVGGYAHTHKFKNSGKFIVEFLDAAFENTKAQDISGSHQLYTFEFKDY